MKYFCLIAGFFYTTICFSFQIKKAQTDSLAFYNEQENPMKAIRYCTKTCTYLLSKNQNEKYCDLMLKKAELYIKLTDFENGFKTLFEAKKIAEKQNLIKKNILITNRISTLYLDTFEFSKSKKYLKESKKLALNINDNVSLESIYSVYFLYHFKTNSDSADYYVKKKQQYIKYVKDPAVIYNYYICLNAYYLSKNETKLFFKYADSALQVANKMSDKDKVSSVKSNISYYYLANLKDYKKAKRECFEIIAMYPKMDNLNRISDTYLNLSFAYEKLGDYKNALLYTNKYLEIHEDIIKGKLEDKTNDIETKYKIDKAENEFKDKEELNKLEHEKSQKLLLTFASLIILAGFIFYFYYQNLLLNQKNKLKEIDSKLQFKIISATLDGQDQERNKISTVLHDHVSAILSSVGLHLSAFESNLTKPQINDLKNT